MTVKRMDNVGIVVESLDDVIAFFTELGLELEGRTIVDGEWAGRVTGLRGQRVEIAMMRTPDRHGRLELSRFLAPKVVADHRKAPVNALGYLRVMFAVDDLDDTLARPAKRGRRSSTKWCSTKTWFDFAASGGPRDCSSASPKSSADGPRRLRSASHACHATKLTRTLQPSLLPQFV